MEKSTLLDQKRKKLVKLSFIALICGTTASLAVSVFAFSSASSLLQVDDISVKTLGAAKLQLGLRNNTTNEIDYYDQLTEDSFTSSSQEQITGRGFYPVSSTFKDKWLVKDADDSYKSVTPKFSREYSSNGAVQFPGNDGVKHYLSQELFVKEVDGNVRSVNIYLGDIVMSPASITNQKAASDLNRKNNMNLSGGDLDKIVDCMRVSILTETNYYIIDPNKNGTTVLAGRLNTADSDEYYDCFGENYGSEYKDKEALYGEYEGDISQLVYSTPSASDSPLFDPSSPASAFNAKTKANNYPLDIDSSIKNGVKLKDEDSITVADLKYDSSKSDNTILFSLNPGESQRIVVSYYIEGWDEDCTDSVQYASFTSTFTLTGQYQRLA